eukprot:scaffold2645_cov112-Isochrysis_galbana.AAC.5
MNSLSASTSDSPLSSPLMNISTMYSFTSSSMPASSKLQAERTVASAGAIARGLRQRRPPRSAGFRSQKR